MKQFEPTLAVKRLVVYRDEEKIAYDKTFHDGVNIIRGENAHGKSTILYLLTYGLGAERVTFNSDSLLCRFSLTHRLGGLARCPVAGARGTQHRPTFACIGRGDAD